MPPKKAKQSTVTTNSKPQSAQYPAPFDKAPTSIRPFLDQLDPKKVYITHVDRNSAAYKQQIFLLTVLLNTTITGLLAWRVYVAAPKYFALTRAIKYASSASVDTKNTSGTEQVWILLRRTFTFLMDYLIFRFVVPWPWSFFFERPANPVTWRWKVRFQLQEIVVRVCRYWDAEDLTKGQKQGDQNAFFKTRILPAVDREFMQKTGYLMMDANWDLDFGLMQDAHTLVKEDKVKMQDLNMMVLVHLDGAGWLAWRFETERDAEEYKRKQMTEFKKALSGMGKESLFWKWQAIVEEERDADGSFTAEAQQRVAVRTAEEFEKAGVDFDTVAKGVGGVAEIPAKTT